MNSIPAKTKQASVNVAGEVDNGRHRKTMDGLCIPTWKRKCKPYPAQRKPFRLAQADATVMSPPGPPASLARVSFQKERDGCRESRRAGKPSCSAAIHLSRVQRQGLQAAINPFRVPRCRIFRCGRSWSVGTSPAASRLLPCSRCSLSGPGRSASC